MANQPQLALSEAADWLGDWHPLAEQLGSSAGLAELGSVSRLLNLSPVHDLASLRQFLFRYQKQILRPFELPTIQTAYSHTARKELRELIGLDQQLAGEPLLQNFAGASRRVGQSQLQKLRPLRDQRIVQRYLNAVDDGLAHGWHTVVYGLTLEVYSLPLRQGLLGYAHQTTRGFIYAASNPLQLSEHTCREMFDDLCAALPEAVDELLQQPVVA